MKNKRTFISISDRARFPLVLAVVIMGPMVSHAALIDGPIQLSTLRGLLPSALLIGAIGMVFALLRRYRNTSHELKDITAELNTTRTRLTQTAKELEHAHQNLKTTNTHYQSILFDASVGLFNIAPDGRCTYVNHAMQQLSGLYQKKAEQQGIASAVHPDDRPRFEQAWRDFMEGDETFALDFRFSFKRGRQTSVVPVSCRANKVLNERKEVESYIGWVTDVSSFHELHLKEQTQTARYDYFVNEALESYFRLAPENPIPLTASPAAIAAAIMESMSLFDCNDTFAAMYGARPSDLHGRKIGEFHGGCGSLKTEQDLIRFVEDGYKTVQAESIKQEPGGTRLNLLNNIVGIIEDNHLVGLWGAQRNVSQQRREAAERDNQVRFMHRILDALPADIHVKDTRCRYLYASRKMTERTRIPLDGWIGKTIHEVMPGTARDHDQHAIEAMKSGKLIRIDHPYEALGKSGWMETLQVPLTSEEGLVEGVIGLSLEITERKNRESEAARSYEKQGDLLKQTRNQLTAAQNEYNKATESLSEALQKLRQAETDKAQREQELRQHLADHRQTEDALRRSETALLDRQHGLEEQLSRRLDELKSETDKYRKWEELLTMKEDALQKAEAFAQDLTRQTAETEDFLQATRAQLIRLTAQYEHETAKERAAHAALSDELAQTHQQLEQSADQWQAKLDGAEQQHTARLNDELKARAAAEKQATRSENLLQKTQEELQQLTERHTRELEEEVTERKAAAEKLMQSMEELDALRQQFHLRLDEETKAIKQELARKQIREKTFRQNEKELSERIRDLEHMLKVKSKEFAEQIQARERAEVQQQQIEQKIELMTRRQQEMVSRETQKLQLHVAEVRLKEIKLRKAASDVLREKEALEEQLLSRNAELETTEKKRQESDARLKAARSELQTLSDEQDAKIASETEALQQQLTRAKEQDNALQSQIQTLQHNKCALEHLLATRDADLEHVRDEFRICKANIKQLNQDHDAALARKTETLRTEMEHIQRTEAEFHKQLQEFGRQSKRQQEHIDALTAQLTSETEQRKQATKELQLLKSAVEADREQTETRMQKQIQTLQSQIKALETREEQLQRELDSSRSTIARRDESISSLNAERIQAADRIHSIEKKLAGIHKEHQAELKQSLAEVKAVSHLNRELVDELNNELQRTLNPVVKTTLLMEQSDNLSKDQRQDMLQANLNCRRLMDRMSYRSELTHIADGSDQLETNCCDLHELMADIDRQFSHRAESKNLFFAVSFAQYQAERNVPRHVETDEGKVRRVLSILLGYAVERTQTGRFGLHTSRKSSAGETVQIAFELAYTGNEANDTLLNATFGPEQDSSDAAELQYGLTLARRYIEMLGGEYTLEYRASGITAITLQFPFKAVKSSTIEAADSKEKKAGAA